MQPVVPLKGELLELWWGSVKQDEGMELLCLKECGVGWGKGLGENAVPAASHTSILGSAGFDPELGRIAPKRGTLSPRRDKGAARER